MRVGEGWKRCPVLLALVLAGVHPPWLAARPESGTGVDPERPAAPPPGPLPDHLFRLKVDAESGDLEAMFQLGAAYYHGEGIPRDLRTAVALFDQAASDGYAPAQTMLGAMHYLGEGVENSLPKALNWIRKAAAQGDPGGQARLALFYYRGEGVPRSPAQAAHWARLAAAQGDPEAAALLGSLFYLGEGVQKSIPEAAAWWRKGEALGSPESTTNLGILHAGGEGVPQSFEEAARYYRLAYQRGSADAAEHLGGLYRSGQGVPRSNEKAEEWYRKAAAGGSSIGKAGVACLLSEAGRDLEEALGFAEEAAREMPEEGDVVDTLGWLYFQLGRVEEARDVCLRAAGLRTSAHDPHAHLAEIFARLGDTEAAARHRSLARPPGTPPGETPAPRPGGWLR